MASAPPYSAAPADAPDTQPPSAPQDIHLDVSPPPYPGTETDKLVTAPYPQQPYGYTPQTHDLPPKEDCPPQGYPLQQGPPAEPPYPAQQGHSAQPPYPVQQGYPAQQDTTAQPGYPAQQHYPPQQGYPLQPGYPAQLSYPPPQGYPPQGGVQTQMYVPQPGQVQGGAQQLVIITAQPVVSYPDYMVYSILNLLFCCCCIGIAAVIKSSDVRSANAAGDRERARASSAAALRLNRIALGVGLVISTIYVILILLT